MRHDYGQSPRQAEVEGPMVVHTDGPTNGQAEVQDFDAKSKLTDVSAAQRSASEKLSHGRSNDMQQI